MAATEPIMVRPSSKTSVTSNINNNTTNITNASPNPTPQPVLNSSSSVVPRSTTELSNYRPSSKQVSRPTSKESTKNVDMNVNPTITNSNNVSSSNPTPLDNITADTPDNITKVSSIRPNSIQSSRPVQDVIPRALTRVISNSSAQNINNQKELDNKLTVIEEDDDVEDVDDIDEVEELERDIIETKPSIRRKLDDDNEIDIDLEDDFDEENAEETVINITSPVAVNQRIKNIRPPLPEEEEESFWKSLMDYLGFTKMIQLEDLGLSEEDIEKIKMISPFSNDELLRLCRTFSQLDWDRRGYITFDEFLTMPAFANNPLQFRLEKILDLSPDHKLTFMAFIEALAIFSDNTPKDRKIRFAFRLYDVNDDGYIDLSDLAQITSVIVTNSYSKKNLTNLLEKTLLEVDRNSDSLINYREFYDVVASTDLELKLRIKV